MNVFVLIVWTLKHARNQAVVFFIVDINEDNTQNVEDTPRMFATEIGTRDSETIDKELVVSNQFQFKLTVSDTGETQTDADDGRTDGNNSASEKKEIETANDEANRVVSPSKSVRFVEGDRQDSDLSHTSKEMKQKMNESIAKQQLSETDPEKTDGNRADDNNKKNQKVTCKDDEIEEIYRKDPDDDDSNSNNNQRHSGQKDNKGENDNRQSSQGTGHNNNDNSKGDQGNKGKQTTDMPDVSEVSHGAKRKTKVRERSGSLTRSRPSSGSSGSSNNAKKDRKKKQKDTGKVLSERSGSFPSSARGRCSRFDKSESSKSHINTLEARSVLHGSSVVTMIGPESPKRGASRSASPDRKSDRGPARMKSKDTFQFFSEKSKPCFETNDDDFDVLYGRGEKTKVKFLLEGEEPELETLFIENDGEVKVKDNKVIDFDVLDLELAMLRTNINNNLTEVTTANEDIATATENEFNDHTDEDTITEESDETTDVEDEKGSETIETIRGDYSSILDKYRKRCMERSELCGEISTLLVTPRETNSLVSDKSSTKQGPKHPKAETSPEKKTVAQTMLSDSGRGSVENLSDLSRSASVPMTPVPRLDLGDCTSDLGLGTSRSDRTITKETSAKDITVANQGETDDSREKTLLQLVCEQLSPLEKVRKS